MTLDYLSLANDATELLRDFGTVCTLEQKTNGIFNPSTNTMTGEIVKQVELQCVRLNYKNTQVDGTVIQRGDAKLLMESNGVASPEVDDNVVLDDGIWQVQNVKVLKPALTAVLFELQLRK